MSRLWPAIVALVSAFSSPLLVPTAAPTPVESEAPDEGDDDDRKAPRSIFRADVRNRLERARENVEGRIAARGLAPAEARAARAEFGRRLLANLAPLQADDAISDEDASEVRRFARSLVGRVAG
jgi:hypothetical protein